MQEKTKEEKIAEEKERIGQWFSDLDENQLAIVEPLIQNAAFMRCTLDDLQAIINREGVIDKYMNGAAQFGLKSSASLQSYNSLVKNYAAVVKVLLSYLPKMKRAQAGSELNKVEMVEKKVEEELRERLHQEEVKRREAEIQLAIQKQHEQFRKEGRPGY